MAKAVALIGVAGLGLASSANALPRPGVRTARPTAARGFNLFAGVASLAYGVNRVNCGIVNNGTNCVDPTGSPVNENGFWPKGTQDNYVFNSGLQIAGFIPGNAGFAWAGDTIGAFFFDPRGDQHHGEGITNIFNAANSADLSAWPSPGNVTDTSLYSPVLTAIDPATGLPHKTISQQDLWVRYWDGNPSLATGRKHSMGLLVDQRIAGWNFPAGNNDIIYVIVRFINITSGVRSDYDSLVNQGYSATDIDDIFALAQNWRSTAQAAYNVTIPANGFNWTNLYASYAEDPDIGDAGNNYSNGDLIFNTIFAYKSNFSEPTWLLPASIFAAPFAAAPGFMGIKYLATPGNLGITLSGNTTNGGAFPDAVGVPRLWRNLSGNLLPTDGTCNVNPPIARRECFWAQSPSDTRMFAASGPFSVAPGHLATTVAALVWAAPVASLPAATPGVVGNHAIPAFSLQGFINAGNMVPGFAIDGTRLFANQDTVRSVDQASGFINYSDANADGVISQGEVNTVPRSLLDKEKVAQTVFDNKFLLPFAPDAPGFFLVAGDGHVTIAWQKSTSETTGNPFFVIASVPVITCPFPNVNPAVKCANPLYDPNFRNKDVEGYRIYRGRTQAEMQVIASFDYAGTIINDFTAEFFDPITYGNACAPELGIQTSCPTAAKPYTVVPLPTGDGITALAAAPVAIPLVGVVQQVPPGGRVALANGTVFNVNVDTAVTGNNSGLPPLTDNGVPFAYIDNGLVNGVRYFYAVTAFSINSLKSGPSSLESPLVTKTVIPRVPSTNNQAAVFVTGEFGGDGTQLNTSQAWPAIDAANGTFAGPVPPANAGSFGFLASVAEALPPGDFTAVIDSVVGGFTDAIGPPGPTLYMTFTAGTFVQHVSTLMDPLAFNAGPSSSTNFTLSLPLVPFDSARSAQLGISTAFAATSRMPVQFTGSDIPISATSPAGGTIAGRYGPSGSNAASRYLLHSRWFDETAGTEPPDPTIDFAASKAHNSGSLTGVDSIWSPQAYRSPLGNPGNAATPQINAFLRGFAYTQTAWYPADFVVTWGAGGTITVRDSTHRTNLPFMAHVGTGYGFVSLANIAAAGISAADLDDGTRTASIGVLQYHSLFSTEPVCSGYWGIGCADMVNTATLQPVDFNDDGVADGNGIMLMINGEPFLMKMAALPAAGTKWHLRAVGGGGLTATCSVALPGTGADLLVAPTDCSSYAFSPANSVRPAFAPGLTFKISVTQAFSIATAAGDISHVHTVPDPYYVTTSLEQTVNTKILRFVNLPNQAVIRIYSASGVLVNIVTHNDQAGGGEAVWDLRNRNNQFVASGVYFYHVEAADGSTKVGRFTIVNFAQ